jgi:hypothetical protein
MLLIRPCVTHLLVVLRILYAKKSDQARRLSWDLH